MLNIKRFMLLSLSSCFFLLVINKQVNAQRSAFVDTEYILNQMPEYLSAQKQLDALADIWQKEADEKQRDIDKLSRAYQADFVLLTDELKKKREDEILVKENDLKNYHTLKFGYDGDLFKERKKLIKPLQEKIASAIKAIAESEQLDIVFDKSSADGLLLYALPRYDKSDDVIKKMGYKPTK